jgi:Tfp pilus assembly protein PilV
MLNMTAKTLRSKAARQRIKTSGVSLIEVLVAIAILTIGMLAILLLFPAGLFAIGTAANSTDANRLAQGEIEKTMASQLQLIGAIYSNDGEAGVNPATFLQNSSQQLVAGNTAALANTGLQYTNGTDVNAFRAIVGETIRVPSLNASSLSLYTVVANPIESGSLTVNGTPWQGISGNSVASANDYLDPGSIPAGQAEYLIDYTNGEICLSAEAAGSQPYDQAIIFTVTGSDGTTVTEDLTVTGVTTMQAGQWYPLTSFFVSKVDGSASSTPGTEPLIPWVRGSDTLVRNFTEVGTPGSGWAQNGAGKFTSDPFQYQMYLPDYVSASVSKSSPSANLGVIAFNPAASHLHGGNGQPLEAVINYNTYDWHIISEDRLVTSQTGTTRLSLTNILSAKASDLFTDNKTKYAGLFTFSDSATSPGTGISYNGTAGDPDFIILDMDTGTQLVYGTDYTVNYPDGSVSFLANSPNTFANDHLRLFYHPANDWAVALSRAPVAFRADTSTTDQTAFTPALSTYVVSGTTIYFPLVDVGKQIDIRYSYVSTSGPTVTTQGLYTITSMSGTTAGVNLSSTTLDTYLPSGVTNITPLSVKGVSLSAIVIWNQNQIWHTRTVSTVLTAPSQFNQTSMQ